MRFRVLVLTLVALMLPTPSVWAAEQPGEGWLLATVAHIDAEHGSADQETLVLISPTGEQTTLWSHTLDLTTYGGVELMDWSADGARALLADRLYDPESARALVIDVVSREVIQVPLSGQELSLIFAPDGQSLIARQYVDPLGTPPLVSIDFTGARTALRTRAEGRTLAGADSLVIGGGPTARQQIRVVTATEGRLIERYRTSGACEPVRWWSAHRVLLTCIVGVGEVRLSTFDLRDGDQRWLTRAHDDRVLGQFDLRIVRRARFMQFETRQGFNRVARVRPDGSFAIMGVPQTRGGMRLVTAEDRALILQYATGPGVARTHDQIVRFDPRTSASTTLMRLPHRTFFQTVLPFGERLSTRS